MNKPKIIHLSDIDTPLLERKSVLLSKKFDSSFKKFIYKLYNDKKTADIIITCHGKEFYCHKILLQQYSYFRDLIEKNKEKPDEVIHHDVSLIVQSPLELKRLLKYSYLGILESPNKGEEFPLLNASRALSFHDAARRIRSWMGTFLSPEDAIGILEYAFKKKHQYLYSVLVRRIGPYANLIFENDLHLSFSFENIKYLLEAGDLWISEFKLFEAVVRWCKNRVKLDEENNKNTNNNLTYKDYFLKLSGSIRYPLMGIRCFSEKIETSGLLPKEIIYQTYRYFITPEELQDKIFGEKYFSRKLIRGFNILRFRFVEDQSISFLKILDQGMEAGLTNSASRTIVTNAKITYPSVYYFEFLFVKSAVTSYTMFGVTKPGNPTRTQYLGNHADGYAIYACNGNKYNRSKSVKYYKKFGANKEPCRVGILLNMVSNPTTMYYYVDGECLGKAFERITLPLVPAVSLANIADVVRVIDNPKIPKTWKTDIFENKN